MPIIGLDLGRHNFRAVELDKQKGKLVLVRYGTYENPRINLETESKEEISAYSNAIKEFYDETGFTTSNTVVSLPEHHVYMRIIKVPGNEREGLKKFRSI
jgi:Tfp pilus assembly PilM family ATPase